jgi:hypothetical protein
MSYPLRCAIVVSLLAVPLTASVREADPSNYRSLLRALKPGDTLSLAPGKYPRLGIVNLNGTPDAWITITGPGSASAAAVIEGVQDSNTVEIENSSYVSIENLRIDSRGIPGAFGISARGHEDNLTHHIRIEGNIFVGQNGGQQTDAISTKTPTWGWIIRYNRILGAGTGMYLGDSDGTQPFVAGIIENNLIQDTIGYNIQIKHQVSLPELPGMPLGPTSTIIRNNVLIKGDRPSPDGDRPNLLVDALPDSGPGSLNLYEIYGNYFLHNHREALFQGAGRFTLHDNVFVDGPYSYPAIVVAKHNGPIKLALVYNNTIYTSGGGIRFSSRGLSGDAVVGNLIFALIPLAGPMTQQSDNITGSLEKAPAYVRSPSFDPGANFYPLPGKCQGAPIDISRFHTDADYTLDFNGTPKAQKNGAVVFRGAYAGEGENLGWPLQTGVKPPYPPKRGSAIQLVMISPGSARAGTSTLLTLTGAGFSAGVNVAITGEGVRIANVTVNSETEVTATLILGARERPGTREVSVIGSGVSSNPLKFRVAALGPIPVRK